SSTSAAVSDESIDIDGSEMPVTGENDNAASVGILLLIISFYMFGRSKKARRSSASQHLHY
ncbi:MAG: LPXTG cell wall anchor domain-containing protein, partial [Clostridiaceae bacterium]|nr:LPXTG cell wall anchor domain-containing protein [Clostridiaceae bacterium]